MKRLVFWVVLGLSGPFVSACGSDSRGAPAMATAPTALASTPQSPAAAPVPFHILHPVEFAMSPMVVSFPPRNEPNAFFQDLQALYRDVLRRPQTAPTFVDPEGQNVWLTEYFRFYLNGCLHVDAMSRTLTEITTGASLPTCGIENLVFPPRDLPFDFQNRLEATYRDVLRRPQTFSFVDSEGANVWLAQYLRLRVSGGCDHATAESRVFTEIRGGGVQPDCRTSPTPTPAPTPSPTPNPNGLPPRTPVGDTFKCSLNDITHPTSCINNMFGNPTAVCTDNARSCSSTGSGTCSTHQGVYCWVCPGALCPG